MILKALVNYYERKTNEPNSDIPPFGWFRGKLDYVVVINRKGEFVNLKTLQRPDGKRMVGRPTLMPFIGKQALKHTNSGKDANLLWDNSSFVFGIGKKGELKLESFLSMLRCCVWALGDEAVAAVIKFIEAGNENPECFSPVLQHSEYGKEISTGRSNISFSLRGDKYPFIFLRPKVKDRISMLEFSDEAPKGTCLITGNNEQPIELCHAVIKGVKKAKPRDPDPNFISFNEQAFVSFGKKQSVNAPSSKRAVFAYTTSLNYLLASDEQRMQLGDDSTVFWAKDPCDFEVDFHPIFAPKKGEEVVSYNKIRSLMSAVKIGIPPEEAGLPFYVLGLAPNASRIAIRFWHEGNVKEIKERVAEHFRDLEMVRAPYDPEFLSMRKILLATTRHSSKNPYGDTNDIVPRLAGEIFKAVLSGTHYPRTLLQKIVNRVKAEQALCDNIGKRLENVTFARAALLKAFLLRNYRISKSTQKEVSMSLDKTYDNIGYTLGRLFAVLERVQEQAQGKGLNKTIRDTYFGAAASSPIVTFKRLQDLAIHHLAKIRNSGKNTVRLEQIMQEVFEHIPPQGIPPILGLEDQGRFCIGYYHQRQAFFTKKESETRGKEKDNE